jgi:predicted HAD superfamily Cof-like phosphohydrolase
MKHLEEAIQFRKAMNQPIATPLESVHELQFNLIREEYRELDEAFDGELDGTHSLSDQLKEFCDLVFVCYQFAAARGWDLDTALTRVYESNMSKLVDGKPIKDDRGKVLKGPNYQPPILDDLL